jgi:c-di-GMP-binding flagellar brake protein YcgR
MSSQNEQTRVELLQSDEHDRYLLRGPREIHQILQGLIDSRALLSAHLAPGNQSFLTTLVAITDDALLLDPSPDELINNRAVAAHRIVCTGHLDRIRIQFPLTGATLARHDNRPVLRAAPPEELLRLQRREFYRLQTPVTETVTCTIPFPHADGKAASVAVRVVDISGGGVAIMVPPDDVPFAPNMEFDHCVLSFPDHPPIPLRLKVRNLFRLTNRNGIEMMRAGCQFIDLPRSADSAIQRYILKVERNRSARERGML